MGGTSQSTTQQQSTTAPWQQAQPLLQGILGSAQGLLGGTGINSTEQNAINQLVQNGANANRFTPAINNSTASLLSGGGALNQAGAIQNAFSRYQGQTNPLASNTNYNPYSTPGFSDALNTLNSDISQQVNGQFAAAGRDGSGYNQQALARGLSQGEGQLLANQYNQNIQNQQSAASNLYGAGNTNAGLLSGLQQQYLANQQAGVGQVGSGLNAQNAGANAILGAQTTAQQLPIQNLGLLASLGTPIGGLGSQSQGSGTTQNQMSGAQQFATIAGGVGNIFKGLFPGGL